MKNKLTNQEKNLQSKLEENSFEYNEANWSDLQNAMGKKGFLSNFSPFLKAAIGLAILTTSVVLINTAYPDSETISPIIKETVVSKEEAIQDNQKQINNSTPTTSLTEEAPSIDIKTSPSKAATIINNSAEKQENSNTETQFLTEGEGTKKEGSPQLIGETVPVMNSKTATIHSIEILSTICLDTELMFEANLTTNTKENLRYTWFINGKRLDGSSLKLNHYFTKIGNHTVTLQVSYEENLLAEASRNIYIPPSPNLDFVATDLADVFYDQNVNVKVLNPNPGKYQWLDENKVVKFGKEAVYTFLNEGAHQISLEYTSNEGCKTILEKEITMRKDFIEAFPNAFSTNGDGINDIFELKVLQIPNTQFELQIVDFSGNIVFKTQDAYKGWNGKVNNTGTDLKKGTFAWTAVITNSNNRKRVFKGKVKLNPGL